MNTAEFMEAHGIERAALFAQEHIFRVSLLQALLSYNIRKSPKRSSRCRYPSQLEFGEWDNSLTEKPKSTAKAFTYIMLKGSLLKGLRPLTCRQFYKVKKSCLAEERFIFQRIEEASKKVVRYRELVHKAIKAVGGKEGLPFVNANLKHCDSYLSETLVSTIYHCTTCNMIFKVNSIVT